MRKALEDKHYGAVFSAMDKLERHGLNVVTEDDVTKALNEGKYFDVYKNMITLDRHGVLTEEHKKP